MADRERREGNVFNLDLYREDREKEQREASEGLPPEHAERVMQEVSQTISQAVERFGAPEGRRIDNLELFTLEPMGAILWKRPKYWQLVMPDENGRVFQAKGNRSHVALALDYAELGGFDNAGMAEAHPNDLQLLDAGLRKLLRQSEPSPEGPTSAA